MTNNPNSLISKPEWLRVKAPQVERIGNTANLLNDLNLNTVCQEASCPNIGECFASGTATFLIMGPGCTRACPYCDIDFDRSKRELDPTEPYRLAEAVYRMKLKHVVITSVDRDDLDDGGSNHFFEVINQTRKTNPNTTIEVLTPDFLRKGEVYKSIVDSMPDVFNHNIETVSRLYKTIRPGAIYKESLNLLKSVKSYNSDIFTKSGLMVGLGETLEDIQKLLMDLRDHKVDFVTIGQYLQPSIHHEKVHKFYTPDEFKFLYDQCIEIGFKMVSSSPLTRSSYHADEDFALLKKNRKLINAKSISKENH